MPDRCGKWSDFQQQVLATLLSVVTPVVSYTLILIKKKLSVCHVHRATFYMSSAIKISKMFFKSILYLQKINKGKQLLLNKVQILI